MICDCDCVLTFLHVFAISFEHSFFKKNVYTTTAWRLKCTVINVQLSVFFNESSPFSAHCAKRGAGTLYHYDQVQTLSAITLGVNYTFTAAIR